MKLTTESKSEIRNLIRSFFEDDEGQEILEDFITGKTLEELGLLDAVFPVGSFYSQLPDAESNTASTAFPDSKAPTALFGGTWELQFDDEGIVFQTEGYDGAGRTDGLMDDQLQGFKIGIPDGSASNSVGTLLGPAITARSTMYSDGNLYTDGTNGTPRKGTRTCHRNRLVRIWKRTA